MCCYWDKMGWKGWNTDYVETSILPCRCWPILFTKYTYLSEDINVCNSLLERPSSRQLFWQHWRVEPSGQDVITCGAKSEASLAKIVSFWMKSLRPEWSQTFNLFQMLLRLMPAFWNMWKDDMKISSFIQKENALIFNHCKRSTS